MASNKAAWLTELRALLGHSQAPSCLVECDGNFQAATRGRAPQPGSGRAPALRERFVAANAAWHRLLEYEEHEVVGRSFSEIRGLQGQLTNDSTKLKLGSLLITKETRVEGLTVVNYTGRTRRPLELQVNINIIKHRGLNIFFMWSIASHREVMVPGGQPRAVPTGQPRAVPARVTSMTYHSLEEPEPEDMPAEDLQQGGSNSWQVSAARRLAAERRPCVLVTCERLGGDGSQPAVLRERVSCANDAWYRLYEYEESEIAQRSFSEIPGFQGPLTSDASVLQLASLMLSKKSVVEDMRMVSYTGRGQRPIEATLHIDIFKENGVNVAFLCTVTALAEVLASRPGPESIQPCEEPAELVLDSDWSRQSSEEVFTPTDIWSRQTTAASQAGGEDPSRGCAEGPQQRRAVMAWGHEASDPTDLR